MFENAILDKFVGKEVQLRISMPTDKRRPVYTYHGKLISYDNDNIEIDDAVFNSFLLPRNDVVSIRELNRADYIYLANQFEVWAWKLKMRQKDEKLGKKLSEIAKKFREMLHDDKPPGDKSVEKPVKKDSEKKA